MAQVKHVSFLYQIFRHVNKWQVDIMIWQVYIKFDNITQTSDKSTQLYDNWKLNYDITLLIKPNV